MRTLFVACVGMVLTLTGVRLAEVAFPHIAVVSAARAQAIPKSLEPSGTEYAVRERKNAATVGVAGGLLSGTYMKFADELAQVLDDGDKLRVLPIVTYGAASNLDDLLYLRGVDVAITQSDVFEYFRTQRKIVNLEKRVNYIIRLPVSEMHVLARNEIKSIEDLRGKKVSFGPAGSASSLTGTIVFQRLGVQVEQALLDNPTAMQKLKSGEISALVRVIGKPIDVFEKIPANSGLHFVSIPFSKSFADYYTVGELTSKDYPTLVGEGERVDTIAVPAVLAAFNWPKGSDRYVRVQRFVQALFANWDKFRQPPRHPKWRDVNLAATVPGWTRLGTATEALDQMSAQADAAAATNAQASAQTTSSEFASFLAANGGANLNAQQREALFRQFEQWQRQHQAQPAR
jgi:TRAP transporter TAXI family solute receptor